MIIADEEEREIWGRKILEDRLLRAQGGRTTVEGIRDLYFRVRYTVYRQGSEEIDFEGYLRQYYRPPDLIRIEEESDTGDGVAFVKVYDDRTGLGFWARHGEGVPERRRGARAIEKKEKIDELKEHLRRSRMLLATYLLRDGAVARLIKQLGEDDYLISWTPTQPQESEEVLELRIRHGRIERVRVKPTGDGEIFLLSLAGHRRFDGVELPTQAVVSRYGESRSLEKVFELEVVPGGLVLNPEIDSDIYISPAEESPDGFDR